MKNTTIKAIAGCLFCASFSLTSFGQSSVLPNDQGGDNPENNSKVDKSTIPGAISDSYTREFPSTSSESWYYYPGYYASESDWYEYDPYATVMEDKQPRYYVVEFTNEKTPYRVVYSKEGKKLITYKTSIENLPKAVITALSKSPYKSWVITKEKEEIWLATDEKRVFKVVVEKGKEKHVLFYKEDGKLIKDKNKS